ncbi:pyridoxamine 5'-phosphate oxidase family protein [Cognatishimia sp. F0-27]|uniref:pyridoxamine 5'-phosphate oxidase family protein n=1 Tax=Cognatishimia sp. F0-27 TaxID=2816855 RepID=UPI001D0C2D75|nr:pyridoxamine 5'-phosphate oxidase family protein [Cognatishimia sp. F0-27]MCC1491249.1 pyridoxamine 5'-phosphate oxidase family protein [Cognatishimia sp. F0-27]
MFATPDELRRAAWQHMARGVADRRHPARHPTLGTIGADGPQLRTVVLRGWDPAGIAEIHTDSASAKTREIAEDPRVALHVWIPKQNLQMRLMATARMIHADEERWGKIPPGAQIVYGGTPAPGTPIDAPEMHSPGATITRFTALSLTVNRLDLVHLGEDLHRRVMVQRSKDGWSSEWVAP